MNNVYKVTLYDGIKDETKSNFRSAGTILAIRTPVAIKELLTGYQLGIVFNAEPLPHQVHLKERQIREYGHQPTVDLNEFVNKNLATPQEIDDYIDNYDSSEWKQIYEEMKIFSTAQKKELKAKVKQVFKSKR